MAAESAFYTTNMATPAANIATVVIATTVHPQRELGCPCISFLSEAITRIAKEGSKQTIDDRCPVERLHRVDACEVQSDTHPSREENESVKRACLLQFLV